MSTEPNYRQLVKENWSSRKTFRLNPEGNPIMFSVRFPWLSFTDAEKLSEKHKFFMLGKPEWPEEWVMWTFFDHYSHIDVWQTFPGSVLAMQNCEYDWHWQDGPITFLIQRSQKGLPVSLMPRPNKENLMVEINQFGPPIKLN